MSFEDKPSSVISKNGKLIKPFFIRNRADAHKNIILLAFVAKTFFIYAHEAYLRGLEKTKDENKAYYKAVRELMKAEEARKFLPEVLKE